MASPILSIPLKALAKSGLKNAASIHYQLSPEELVQDTLRIGEGVLNNTGALVIRTGEFTGRSPKDKFTVKMRSRLIPYTGMNSTSQLMPASLILFMTR